MKKIPIIINVAGGIVDSVNSPVDLNVLVLDYDKHGSPELSASRREVDPTTWNDTTIYHRDALTIHGDQDPAEFSDVLTPHPRPTLEKVELKAYYDDHPHHEDYLGEFKNDADSEDLKRGSAFRWKPGDSRTLEYFIPAISVDEHKEGLRRLGYAKGVAETLARSYCRQAFTRAEGLDAGDWCYIGIMAKATVKTPVDHNPGCFRLETFTSGGLWGIESDSGSDHIGEIHQEELDDLKSHLEDFGVDLSNWDDLKPDTGEVDDIEPLR